MSLTNYPFPQAAQFLTAPEDHWKRMNFRGEVYEAAFYENLRTSLGDGGPDGMKLVAKGPFANPTQATSAYGFQSDNSGNCRYMDSGISLAEFDCMTVDVAEIHFYECTLTQHRANLRTLKAEAMRKIALLRLLFPQHRITCTVVCDSQGPASFFARLPGFKSRIFNPDLPDLIEIARNSRLLHQPPMECMMTLDSLNKRTTRISYLDEVRRRSLLLPRRHVLAEVRTRNLCADGLFPRLYWGRIAAGKLGDRIGPTKEPDVVVALNLESVTRPRIRYYHVDLRTNAVYETLATPRRIDSIKASRTEILEVNRNLPNLGIEDIEGLEAEIRGLTPAPTQG